MNVPLLNDSIRPCQAPHPLRDCCGANCVDGTNFCAAHAKHCNNTSTAPTAFKHSKMGKLFYSKRLGPKLTTALEEFVNSRSRQEQLSVIEEIGIIKEIAGDILEVHSRVVETEVGPTLSQADRNDLVIKSGQLASDAMTHVINVCEKAARIDALGTDKISIHAVRDMSMMITRIVHEVFDNDVEGMIRFDQAMTDHLHLPSIGGDLIGTNITVDRDVREMDSTVPIV